MQRIWKRRRLAYYLRFGSIDLKSDSAENFVTRVQYTVLESNIEDP
jgi:hypothetical protein